MASLLDQRDLFDAAPALPQGFVYERELITRDEEAALLASRPLPPGEGVTFPPLQGEG